MRSFSPIPARSRLAVGALLVAVAACGRDEGRAAPDSVGARPDTAGAPASRAAGPATDAGTNGLWTLASLEKRLDLQGMAPRRLPDTVRHAFLAIPGTAYRLGNAELQVFIYDDVDARTTDVGRLDTVTVSPPSAPVQWPRKATLITNANLAAILLGENPLQIERVQRALMAGTGSTVLDPGTPR